MTDFAANIAAVYARRSESDTLEGMSWYPTAHALAKEISPSDVWRGAGIIAAFSPLTPWPRNEILARDSARTGVARTDTLGNSSRAAQRILDGEDPLSVLKGTKTNHFCQNIALAGVSDVCTIDVHAFGIANGEHVPSSRLKGLNKSTYAAISEAYGMVAEDNDLFVPQLQAITWVTWRRERKVNTKAAA